MSLILDALNRSQNDESPVPNLASCHPVEPISSGRRLHLPWVALSVALVLIVWLVMERFTAPSTPVADIAAPVAELTQNMGSAAASVTTELKAPAVVQEKELQPIAAKTPPVATVASPEVVDEEVATANSSEMKPAGKLPAIDESVTATPLPATENAAVARLYQNRGESEDPEVQAPGDSTVADSPSAARSEQPVDIEEILQQAQEDIENASLDDHPAPFLSSLSQQTKDDIPTLYYRRHDYSSDASISTVVLNGTKVKVGGSPVSGMKVDEILPHSVVLSYRGTQFRLRALNSWINL